MPEKRIISSRHNQKIKDIRKLIKNAKKERIFILEGLKIIKEAIDAKYNFLYFLSSPQYLDKEKNLISRIKNKCTNFLIVSPKIISYLSGLETSPGLFALAKAKEYQEEVSKDAIFLLFDNISDPGNLGTIFRIAQGFKVKAIYLSKNSVSPFNEKVIRASMGSVLRVKFFENCDLEKKIKYLKRRKFIIYATNPKLGKEIDKVEFKFPLALIFGNESRGVSEKISSLSHEYVKIPLKNQLDSLNISVSAGIILYILNQKRNLIIRGG